MACDPTPAADVAGKILPGAGPGRRLAAWTHVDGVSFDVIRGTAQAQAAGTLVGRFHRALDDFDHPFVGMRLGVHDTPNTWRACATAFPRKRTAITACAPRWPPGRAILARWRLPPLPVLPDRVATAT